MIEERVNCKSYRITKLHPITKNIFIKSTHNNFIFRRILVKIEHVHLLQFYLVNNDVFVNNYLIIGTS